MNYRKIQRWPAACLMVSAVAGSVASTSLYGGPLTRASSLDAKSVGLPAGIPTVDEAIDEFRRGRNGRALELLKTATARRPDLPPAKLMLARMMLASGQDVQGRAILEEVVAEHPDHSGAYVLFGSLALAEGRVADASLQFERAQSLAAKEVSASTSPQAKEVRVQCASGLATIAERRRAWRDAMGILSGWLALEPSNGPVRQRLARALVSLGRVDEAYKHLQRAVQDDPKLEPAAVGVGRFLAEAGQREQAGRWLERAVQESPKHAGANIALATWFYQGDELARARALAEAAEGLEPRSTRAKLLLAMIGRRSKDFGSAEAHLRAILQESPADYVASNQLSLVLADQSDEAKRTQAVALAESNARQYPKLAEALATLGWAYSRLGRWDEAHQALRAASPEGRATPDTAYYLALVLEERGEHEEAVRLVRSALGAPPGLFALREDAKKWIDGRSPPGGSTPTTPRPAP